MEENPKFRLFAGLARSGTTMLQKALGNLPDTVTTRAVIVNRDPSCPPDWSIFSDFTRLGVRNVIDRENIGARSLPLCTAPLFRGPEDMEVCRPLFVLRDPVATYGSWVKQGWGNIDLFLTAFTNLERIMSEAVDQYGYGRVLSYEELTTAPETVLKEVLNYWGIAASPDDIQRLVVWPKEFSVTDTTHGTELFDQRRGALIRECSERNLASGVHSTLAEGEQRIRSISEFTQLSDGDHSQIEALCRDSFDKRIRRTQAA